MADDQIQDEILELTELIEKGPNTSVNPALDPKSQTSATLLDDSNEQTKAHTLNDPPGSQGPDDLDQLLAKFDQPSSPESKAKPMDPHEGLDMSDLDHVDDMLASLPKRQKEKKDIQEVINDDLNDLLAAVDAEPQPEPKKKTPQDDLNSLISSLGDPNDTPPPEFTKKADPDPDSEIDEILAQIPEPTSAKKEEVELKEKSEPAPKSKGTLNLDEDPNLQGMSDLDALLSTPAPKKEPVKPKATENKAQPAQLTALEERLSKCEASLLELQDNLASRLSNFENGLSDLESKLNEVKEDFNSEKILASNSPLEQKIKELINQALEENLPQAAAQDDGTKDKIQALNQQYQDLSENLLNLEKNVNTALANANLETRIANLENSQSKLTSDLTSSKDNLANLENLNTSILELTSKIQEHDTTLSEINLQLSNQSKANPVTEELLNSKLDPLTLENTNLSEEITSIKDQLNSFKSELEAKVETELQSFAGKLADQSSQNYVSEEQLFEKIAPITSQNESLSSNISSIQDQLGQLQTNVESQISSKLTTLASTIEDLEAKSLVTESDLTQKLEPIISQNDSLLKDFVTIQSQLENLTQNIESNLPLEIEQLKAEIDKQKSEPLVTEEALTAKLAPLNSQQADLAQDLATFKTQALTLQQALRTEMSTKISQLTTKVNEMPEAVSQADFTQKMSEVESNSEFIKADLLDLKQELAETKENLTSNLEGLNQNLEQLKAEEPKDIVSSKDLNTKLLPLITTTSQINKHLSSLEQKIKTREEEWNNQGESQNQALKQLKEELTLATENLETKFSPFEAKTEALSQDLANLTKDLALTQESMAANASSLIDLTAKLSLKANQPNLEELAAKLLPLEKATTKLAQDLNHTQTNLEQELAAKLLPLEKATTKLAQDLNHTQANLEQELESQSQILSDLTKQAAEHAVTSQITTEDLDAKLNPLATSTSHLSEDLNSLQQAQSHLKTQLQTVLDQITKLKSDLEGQEALTSKLSQIESATSHTTQNVNELKQKLQGLSLDLQSKLSEALNNQAQDLEVKKLLNAQEGHNQELVTRLKSLEERLNRFEPEFYARIDRAAASSAARILREELAALLANG
ncbi:MAG: hypothetical protein IJU40_06835 [Desulfovibrionaceae bacterium]|nr:hypothetical protein [Desulfovibrionaceae bacterium]